MSGSVKGVRVNAIAPGYMSTQFTASHREDPRDMKPCSPGCLSDDGVSRKICQER